MARAASAWENLPFFLVPCARSLCVICMGCTRPTAAEMWVSRFTEVSIVLALDVPIPSPPGNRLGIVVFFGGLPFSKTWDETSPWGCLTLGNGIRMFDCWPRMCRAGGKEVGGRQRETITPNVGLTHSNCPRTPRHNNSKYTKRCRRMARGLHTK